MSKVQSHSEDQAVPETLRAPHEYYETAILRRVWDRLHRKNEHFVMALVGREGSGKSLTALRLAKEVDPSFDADRVIFDVGELLRILNDGDHEPGNAYVLDEAGVSLGRRTWQERGQVLANQALQLVRSHNLALFFTLPALGELDSQAQTRLQAFYEITDKVPDEFVEGKWKYLDPDRSGQTNKVYHKYPRIYQNGSKKRVTRLKFGPPDDELSQQYNERKSQHQEEFYEKTLDELSPDEDEEDDDQGREPKEVAEKIKSDGVDDVVSIHGGNKQPYIDAELIEMDYDVSRRDASRVKKLLERDEDISLTDRDRG